MLISVSNKLQCFVVVTADAVAGSVVLHWTMDRKVNALTGSNPLRVVLGTSLPCTLFCQVVLKRFTIRQNKCHFGLLKQQFCWPYGGF